ncbi:MAG: MFS transporter [Tractidigestivibacter sp.]|jgi:MFS family permease|uniref:MFS transporter n=1 Tax=Tractidigestivibacter sp. TaxID=2847320 RepID=UPI003D91B70D
MAEEHRIKHEGLVVTAIILTSFCYMHDMVIIPAVNSIYEQFADSPGLANFIVSGPAGVMIITELLTPRMLRHVGKKRLMTIAMVVFAFASIFGAAIVDPVYMAVARGIVGAAVGVIATVPLTLISELYEDEGKRSWLMGLYNAGMTGIGFVLGILSGYVASSGWQGCFRLYWITVPILVLWVLVMPETGKDSAGEQEAKRERFPMGGFVKLLVVFFLIGVFYAIIYYQISVYVSEQQIGDEMLAGTLSSLGTLGGFVISFLFGGIFKRIQERSFGVGCLALAASILILYLFPSVAGSMIATFLIGAAWGFIYTAFTMDLTTVVPQSFVNTSVSVGLAVAGLCMFASTYVTTLLQMITGSSTISSILPIGVVVSALCGVITLVSPPKASASEAAS